MLLLELFLKGITVFRREEYLVCVRVFVYKFLVLRTLDYCILDIFGMHKDFSIQRKHANAYVCFHPRPRSVPLLAQPATALKSKLSLCLTKHHAMKTHLLLD